MNERCPGCGALIAPDTAFCTRCGTAIGAGPQQAVLSSNDKWLILLGNVCLSPLLGVALYLVWKDSQPRKAQESCTLTWITVAIWVVFILGAVVIALAMPHTGKGGNV